MDMKELLANGCFTPEWTEAEEQEKPAYEIRHKELDVLLNELAEIKENIEQLQAKSWYLDRLRQYHEHGFADT